MSNALPIPPRLKPFAMFGRPSGTSQPAITRHNQRHFPHFARFPISEFPGWLLVLRPPSSVRARVSGPVPTRRSHSPNFD